MKQVNTTVTAVTFGIFMAEAILHYNLGVHKDKTETRKFVFPPTEDFIKLAAIVGVFSLLNGVIVAQLTK